MQTSRISLWIWKVGGVTVNVQGTATDEHPLLCDIFCLVQCLLDIKASGELQIAY